MAQAAELPNKLFANGRGVLAKFGYGRLDHDPAVEDWPAMWDLLKGDFAVAARPEVPSFGQLGAAEQAAAMDYMRRRIEADHSLEICERLHVELFAGGIDTARVERYSAARETYETCVEEFGEARERLEALLRRKS